MTIVTDWTGSLFHGVTAGIDRLMGGIPTILGALLILIVGWMIAGWLAALATRFIRAVHLDTLADRINVNDFLERAGTRMKASGVLGEVVKWVLRLVFIEIAADQLNLPQVTAVINRMLFFVPNILVALLVLGVGAFLAQLLTGVARGAAAEAGWRNTNIVSKLAYGVVMAFAIIAAVNQLNISPVVVNTLYIGLVAAISLALGLAFGLGGRETAARLTEQWIGQVQETAARMPAMNTAEGASSAKPVVSVRSERPLNLPSRPGGDRAAITEETNGGGTLPAEPPVATSRSTP